MIKIVKPLRYIRKEGTTYKPSIVAVGKIPHTVNDIDGITAWIYFVYINLWLIEIEFQFLLNAKKVPTI